MPSLLYSPTMKMFNRLTALFLCALIFSFSLSSCSLVRTAVETAVEIIAEPAEPTEPPKGFEEGDPDGYLSIDCSSYAPSPYYTPIICTESYDRLTSDEERLLYDNILSSLYVVYPSSDLDAKYWGLYRCRQVVMEGVLMTESQILTVLKAIYDDHPEIFWLETYFEFFTDEERNYTAVRPYSCFSADDIEQWLPKLHDAVDAFTASVPEGLSSYELEKFTHDFIINSCTYNKSDANSLSFYHSVYGVMVKNKAVCEGYARAFQMLLNLLGIDCVGVTGNAIEEDGDAVEKSLHMWNAVNLDGDWYYVDPTWDDPDDDSASFCYEYFNVNSEIFFVDHEPSATVSKLSDEALNTSDTNYAEDLNIFVPECDSMTYNYIVRECPHLTNYYDASEIKDALYETALKKEDCFVFYVDPDFTSAASAESALFAEYPQYFFEYIDAVNYRLPDYSIENSSLSYYCNEALSYILVDLYYT